MSIDLFCLAVFSGSLGSSGYSWQVFSLTCFIQFFANWCYPYLIGGVLGIYSTKFSPSINALNYNSSNTAKSGSFAPQKWILSSNFQPYILKILVTYLMPSAPTSGFELSWANIIITFLPECLCAKLFPTIGNVQSNQS